MEEKGLKPCPFCACTLFETSYMPDNSRAQSKISCGNCGVTIYAHGAWRAVLAWNTRPIEDAQTKLIEAQSETLLALERFLHNGPLEKNAAIVAEKYYMQEAQARAELEALTG